MENVKDPCCQIITIQLRGEDNKHANNIHQVMSGEINVAYTYKGILFGNKKNEVWMHISTWMNLENLMLNERNQSQKTVYSTIPFVCNVQN